MRKLDLVAKMFQLLFNIKTRWLVVAGQPLVCGSSGSELAGLTVKNKQTNNTNEKEHTSE